MKLPLNNNDDDENDSDLLIQCVKDQYIALWLLPELESIVPSLQRFIENNNLCSNNVVILPTYVSSEYRRNNWELYRSMREKRQSTNPIAKSIETDDIDEFQQLFCALPDDQVENTNRRIKDRIIRDNSKVNYTVPIFEFDLYSGCRYVDYAAFHGSIKCFKFLILNEAIVTSHTFDTAIEGGNIEIIRIVEQKLNEIGDETYYDGEKYGNSLHECSVFPRRYLSSVQHWNGILRSIYKHENKIFDWIFENKSISVKELTNLLYMASLSNNVHILLSILSKNSLVSFYDLACDIYNIITHANFLGFSFFIRILIEYIGLENYKGIFQNCYKIPICYCDIDLLNMTYFHEKDFALFNELCRYDSTDIFITLYNQKDNIRSLEYLGNRAIMNGNEEIFKFILDQVNLNFNSNQKEILIKKFLKNSVKCKCFPIIKCIIQYKKDQIDFTQTIINCIIMSAKNGYENIFDYLLQLLPSKNNEQLIIQLINNLIDILYSENLKITKTVLKLINDEKYTKRIIYDALIDSYDNLTIPPGHEPLYSLSSKLRNKNLFGIPNVTEYLISYIDNVIPEFLIAAALIDNVKNVKAIVSKNSSYNFLNNIIKPFGNVLIIACQLKLTKIAKFLLRKCQEIDPNIDCDISLNERNPMKVTPLMISVFRQSTDIMQEIIQYYKSKQNDFVNSNDSNLKTSPYINGIQKALAMLINGKQMKDNSEFKNIISTLITLDGININEIYCDGSPFIYVIAQDCLIDLFNLALSIPNVNPNFYNNSNRETSLMKAIRLNQTIVMHSLLSHKDIDINFESLNHVTALSMAVSQNKINVVNLIVQHKNLKINLNYLACLKYAILNDFSECAKLLLSRDDCDVNKLVSNQYIYFFNQHPSRLNPNNNLTDLIDKCIEFNFKKIEQSIPKQTHSVIQTAAQKENTDIIKLIINHPKFVADKFTLTLALFESAKNKNMDIFFILLNQFPSDVDILSLHDMNNNSLIVVASASNNIELMKFIVKDKKISSSIYNNQLAFIVAPSDEMMELIIKTLPGVNLNDPMQNGSNYLTSLVDFYYKKNVKKDSWINEPDEKDLKEQIIVRKVRFILSNSNLKLATKDINGHSFISKITSDIYCINKFQIIVFLYSLINTKGEKESKIKINDFIDEETQMNPLHFFASHILIRQYGVFSRFLEFSNTNNSNCSINDCEDEFDFLVNKSVFDSNRKVICSTCEQKIPRIFADNKHLFKDDVNKVDFLNQTPMIKAVLNLNLPFANFLLSECSANIEVVDVFGNTMLDYLLMIVKNYGIMQIGNINFEKIENVKKLNQNECCSLIISYLLDYFLHSEGDLDTKIIIKLSNFLK